MRVIVARGLGLSFVLLSTSFTTGLEVEVQIQPRGAGAD
jgi:hypothetical protein